MDLRQRTLKISLAAVVSILIAQALTLQNPLSAGVVALLSILDTRLDSIQTGLARFLSTILAFIIATIVFSFLGFTVWALGIFLLFYVPLAYIFKLEAGISPCTVLVTHFIGANSVSWLWQINGLSLMTIGVVVAVLFNFWMPSQEKKIEEVLTDVEEQLRVILHMLNRRLREEDFETSMIKVEMKRATDLLQKMKSLALTEYDNQLMSKDDYYIQYADMRQRQLTILEQMLTSLQAINLQTEQSNILAGMFQQTADELHEMNSGVSLLDDIRTLYVYFRDSSLPQTRKEFESRAILYHILLDFERFLELKHGFYNHYATNK